ncbi:Glyoxylase, beta-lactamase superfamily II [Altererythrobacter xiamenensis]|uniref:Glyoxylase, beta-lactamase superfamily II n=1 Tax=Altererythrobacter xiamenensis TaxID=1316679 RepID=A0A1Y6FNT7_9SPHN|nr:MBL fold metallo-hydrolase [Altererythrobacter xiamenensis]SMQ74502.1 Glyoxylase, beta-lactamase superfamily II [Altererythrobacter xiamenensis]
MNRTAASGFAALSILLATPTLAQGNLNDVKITAEEVAPGVAVLFGAGGNIGVSHGEDATILIDDQFAPLTEKIEAAVAGLGASPAEYVINTHWHFDHTGGNENFGKRGAKIFAHDNVRKRLKVGDPDGRWKIPPAPAEALPVVTYERGVTLHLNGDTIDVMFLGGGHTDGDSIVRWREKNVVHMGDLYFNSPGWPFIDVSSGGGIEKALYSIDSAIAMMDEDTKVIPGHGPMSDRAGLTAYRNIVGEAVTRIRALKDIGVSLEDAQARRPLDSFERGEGFISEDEFIAAVWDSLD